MVEHQKYQVNPNVSCGDEEDGAVLYNPDTDGTAIINSAGRTLWALLAAPRTVQEMTAFLTTCYRDVSAEQAAADVAQFVQSLLPDFVQEAGHDGH